MDGLIHWEFQVAFIAPTIVSVLARLPPNPVFLAEEGAGEHSLVFWVEEVVGAREHPLEQALLLPLVFLS